MLSRGGPVKTNSRIGCNCSILETPKPKLIRLQTVSRMRNAVCSEPEANKYWFVYCLDALTLRLVEVKVLQAVKTGGKMKKDTETEQMSCSYAVILRL